MHESLFRIYRHGNKYFPHKRVFGFYWRYIESTRIEFGFSSLEEAEKVIDEYIEKEKKYYIPYKSKN